MYFIFPGVYSKRFKGISKAKHEGIGYKIPSKQELEKMLESLVKLENNTFLVSSSSGNIRYMVDMNSGFCQCKIGYNGSPCKHQYVLWISKLAPCSRHLMSGLQNTRICGALKYRFYKFKISSCSLL